MNRFLKDVQLCGKSWRIVDLPRAGGLSFSRLPWSLRVLLENVVRNGGEEGEHARLALIRWLDRHTSTAEVAFYPGRVLMHDTTCGPALADIAAMRSALAEVGGDPADLSPIIPVDISTCHSLPVEYFARADAMRQNMSVELRRNAERYRFVKWATGAMKSLRAHPPGTGIMHTLNLERLATVVATQETASGNWAFPDVMIGTDSHTPMVNGIGVLAVGVGGLEAESVMFGVPMMMRLPEVIGVRLTGRLGDGILASDLALTLTEMLRKFNVGSRFVEFFGPGVSTLSAGDRACVANMAPEYGAATGYFPIDAQTIAYLRRTGRGKAQAALVESYAKLQGLWFNPQVHPDYTHVLELDLGSVGISVAGPRRPQDRIEPAEMGAALSRQLGGRTLRRSGPGIPPDGAVAIAAISSCTHTTEHRLLIAAGILARKAHRLRLKPPAWVKTSMAPGSPSAERYLARAGLLEDLEAVGFGIVGYGCTTCIGNSGPLTAPIVSEVKRERIAPVVVLSGNRNFPGRVHPDLDAGFLMSPPLVIAFALTGDINRDILTGAIGRTPEGTEVFLKDIWPSGAEIDAAMAVAIDPADVAAAAARAEANPDWAALEAPEGALFPWDPASTYIRRPPFAAVEAATRLGHYEAHPLLVLGDDITTDHISPVGQIPADSDAGRYLLECGENPADLNVYASRRANWEVMIRGGFTNKAVRNLLDSTLPPGMTVHAGTGDRLSLIDAAERYHGAGQSTVIVAGERYGMGSSRDWAAKVAGLLGVRAVLAVSFERIHRANLVGMGVLPIVLPPGMTPEGLGLVSGDRLEIDVPADALTPRDAIGVVLRRGDGTCLEFTAMAAVETALEANILRKGGVIPFILQRYTGGGDHGAGDGGKSCSSGLVAPR